MVKCFIIGAGASIALKNSCNFVLPTDKNFYETLEKRNKELYNKLDKIIPLNSQNKYLTLEQSAIKIKEEYEQTDEMDIFINNLELAIFELICIPSFSDRMSETLEKNEENLYKILIDSIDKNDFFICLNYDLLLDAEIIRKRKTLNLNKDYSIDYGYITNSDHYSKLKIIHDKIFTLYKPHGSCNWGKYILSNYKPFVSLNSIKPEENRWYANITSPLTKENYSNSIWDSAMDRIKNNKVEHLIIIGCSLNEEDKDLWNLIYTYYVERGKTISICNKTSKSMKDKFENFKDIEIKYYDGGLTIENLEKILKKLS